jgi:hypothetical protein
MTTKTTTIPASSTATGFAYTIELDTEISYVAISWFHDGEDQMVESSAPGGVLLACDVPVDDQALLATAVFELASAGERSPSGIRYEIILNEGWITLRWNDPDDGVECFTSPSRRGDLPEQIGEGDPDRAWLLREVDARLAQSTARARTLIAYDTGDALRDATPEEAAASDAALADPCGGGTGVIRVVHEGETISAYVEA